MTTELVPKNINAAILFTQNGLDPLLMEIKKKVDEFEPNLKTAAGRKEIASFAYKIAQSKTFIDDLGKKLVADRKAEIKMVDEERKRARDFLDSEKERARKPLTEWEEFQAAEQEKIRLEAEFNIAHSEAIQINELFNREREIKRKEAELARIVEEQRKKEELELKEKQRIAYELKIKQEAEERAKQEAQSKIELERQKAIMAEQEAKELVAKLEREKIAAEERSKIEKEKAEQEKKDAIQNAIKEQEEKVRREQEEANKKAELKRIEDEQKASDLKHRANINNETLKDLIIFGIDENLGKKLICKIAKNQIKNLYIRY